MTKNLRGRFSRPKRNSGSEKVAGLGFSGKKRSIGRKNAEQLKYPSWSWMRKTDYVDGNNWKISERKWNAYSAGKHMVQRLLNERGATPRVAIGGASMAGRSTQRMMKTGISGDPMHERRALRENIDINGLLVDTRIPMIKRRINGDLIDRWILWVKIGTMEIQWTKTGHRE